MEVADKMTRNPRVASPDDAIRDAASAMARLDTGVLPVVGGNDRLVGTATDRDIAARAAAEEKSPDIKVREAMTPDVRHRFEDEDLAAAARRTGEQQVRRMPALNRDMRLAGRHPVARRRRYGRRTAARGRRAVGRVAPGRGARPDGRRADRAPRVAPRGPLFGPASKKRGPVRIPRRAPSF